MTTYCRGRLAFFRGSEAQFTSYMICHVITNTKTVIVNQHNVPARLVTTIKNNITVSEVCDNGQDVRTSYELYYTTDSRTLITTCDVSGTECSNGICHHELRKNTADSRCQPPVSQFSGEGVTVSVSARNIVGRSNPAVSRSISEFSEG